MSVPNLYICPALRLFVPFAAGIYAGDSLFFSGVNLPQLFYLLVLGFSILFLFMVYKWAKSYAFRWLFGVSTFFFLFMIGICSANIHLQQNVFSYPQHETMYRAVLTGQPQAKAIYTLCAARVLQMTDSLGVHTPLDKEVLLYFNLDSTVQQLRRNDELLFSARLTLPTLRGNPDEFDYPRYLTHKGISATAYINAGKWEIIHSRTEGSFREYALDCRNKVLDLYRKLGFEGDEFAVLSALTVGYKEELSEDIRESYSVSGASHVLALSGLHIGFLYFLLLFLVKRIPIFVPGMEWLRIIIVLIPLWLFAWIAGFSPSVVRAVTMFSLLGISRFFSGGVVSVNTLFVAAMGMLLYNPLWLFDVGFQLSYTAVLAILLVQPWLYRQFSFRNSIMDYVWQLSTVSIAAQLGTAPLVIFYFSRFPVHFLLTNILVVPLVSVIIYLAVALLLFSFWPIVSQWVAYGLNLLLKLLNEIVRMVEHLPFASIERLWIYPVEVVMIYVALLLCGWYVMRKRANYLIACLVVVLSFSVFHVWMKEADRPQPSLVFYNVRHCPVVHCIASRGESWLAYADSIPDEKRVACTASNYWNRLRLAEPQPVTTDYSATGFTRRNNILSFGHKTVCILNDNRWKGKIATEPFSVDYVYLCKGYTEKIEPLTLLFTVGQVVVDASVSGYRIRNWQDECDRLGIPMVCLSDGGTNFPL